MTELKPYFVRRQELTVEENCLLRGILTIIPLALRDKVLHSSHSGVVKMKSLARIHVWWPGIDAMIAHTVKGCTECQSVGANPSPVFVHPWAWPTRNWKRVHINFAGPVLGRMLLIIVDARSKWIEAIPMTTTTAEKTVEVLRGIFAQFGLPEQIVSDNGPQFVAEQFSTFLQSNGINHIKSPPYHPASNREAERFVKTVERKQKVMKNKHHLNICWLIFCCI